MTFRKKPRTFTFSTFEDFVDHQACPIRGARDDDNVRGRSETQKRQEKRVDKRLKRPTTLVYAMVEMNLPMFVLPVTEQWLPLLQT